MSEVEAPLMGRVCVCVPFDFAQGAGGESPFFPLVKGDSSKNLGKRELPTILLFSLLNKERIGEDSIVPKILLIPSPMRRGTGRGRVIERLDEKRRGEDSIITKLLLFLSPIQGSVGWGLADKKSNRI